MMECIKNCFVHECITFNHFIGGCGNMKDEQKKHKQIKQIQRRANQKEFCENVRYVSN